MLDLNNKIKILIYKIFIYLFLKRKKKERGSEWLENPRRRATMVQGGYQRINIFSFVYVNQRQGRSFNHGHSSPWQGYLLLGVLEAPGSSLGQFSSFWFTPLRVSWELCQYLAKSSNCSCLFDL